MKKVYISPASYCMSYESLDCTMALHSRGNVSDAIGDRENTDVNIPVHNTEEPDDGPNAKPYDRDLWGDLNEWDLWN